VGNRDLCVDYSVLEKSKTDLTTIKNEFENASRHKDAVRGSLGSGEVASAMDEFVDNWDYHRKDLLESIEALLKMVEETINTFQKTDQKLADNVSGKK
jgi:hypothetical protein